MGAFVRRIWFTASLQTKFLLITVPLMLFSTSAFFAVVHINASANARAALDQRMAKVAEIQSSSISGLLWDFNFGQIKLILDAMANDPDLVGAVVLDERGEPVGKVGVMDAAEETVHTIEVPILHRRPASEGAQEIGRLQLAYSERRLREAADSRLVNAGVIAILLTISVVVSALVALRTTIRVPLLRLLDSIHLAREQNVRQVVDWRTGDEIGTIIRAYNDLQEKQEAYETQLRNIHDALEQRVVERTQELKGREVELSEVVADLKNREAELLRAKEAAEAALADLKRAQERLVQAEKMASLGQLTAGIAHEIKNPLNFVNNFAKLSDEMMDELAALLEKPVAALGPEERAEAEELLGTVRDNLTKISQHGKRADSIVKNMLMHAREGPSVRQTVSLNALAEEALNLAYHGARAEHPGFDVAMETRLSPDAGEIECYPQDLMRVFLNLISNAMYAADKRRSEAGEGFVPTLEVMTRADGEQVELEVRDNGSGIPPELRNQIFVPFFTTKPAGEGTGLGLSLSYEIVVKQHGGDIVAESEPGEFTAFRVTLPRRLPDNGEGENDRAHSGGG